MRLRIEVDGAGAEVAEGPVHDAQDLRRLVVHDPPGLAVVEDGHRLLVRPFGLVVGLHEAMAFDRVRVATGDRRVHLPAALGVAPEVDDAGPDDRLEPLHRASQEGAMRPGAVVGREEVVAPRLRGEVPLADHVSELGPAAHELALHPRRVRILFDRAIGARVIDHAVPTMGGVQLRPTTARNDTPWVGHHVGLEGAAEDRLPVGGGVDRRRLVEVPREAVERGEILEQEGVGLEERRVDPVQPAGEGEEEPVGQRRLPAQQEAVLLQVAFDGLELAFPRGEGLLVARLVGLVAHPLGALDQRAHPPEPAAMPLALGHGFRRKRPRDPLEVGGDRLVGVEVEELARSLLGPERDALVRVVELAARDAQRVARGVGGGDHERVARRSALGGRGDGGHTAESAQRRQRCSPTPALLAAAIAEPVVDVLLEPLAGDVHEDGHLGAVRVVGDDPGVALFAVRAVQPQPAVAVGDPRPERLRPLVAADDLRRAIDGQGDLPVRPAAEEDLVPAALDDDARRRLGPLEELAPHTAAEESRDLRERRVDGLDARPVLGLVADVAPGALGGQLGLGGAGHGEGDQQRADDEGASHGEQDSARAGAAPAQAPRSIAASRRIQSAAGPSGTGAPSTAATSCSACGLSDA